MFLANKLVGAGVAEKTYADDVFSTYLYTGSGSSLVINNGIDLVGKGGMIWAKKRSIAANASIVDTARGKEYQLYPDGTNAQGYNASLYSSFNNNGFTVEVGNSESGTSYCSWTFRRAAKFFDIVTYTGTGSGQTVAHGLTSTPGVVLIKSTGSSGTNWAIACYLGSASNYAYWSGSGPGLNGTAAATSASFNSSSYIGSTSINTGLFSALAVSAPQTHVAYLFGHNTSTDGIIRCGSYIGNGNTIGPAIDLGWEPQWLMVKNVSGLGSWNIIDNLRGFTYDGLDQVIQANSTAVETEQTYIGIRSDGFQVVSTSSEVNTSGATYVYMAIRRSNKPPTSGASVFTVDNATGFTDAPTIAKQDLFISAIRSSANGYTPAGFSWGDRVRGYGSSSTKTINSSSTASEVEDTMFPFGVSGYVWNAGGGFPRITYRIKRAVGFFDIVGYKGTGAAQDVKHNLSVLPELILLKNRTTNGMSWKFRYSAGEGNLTSDVAGGIFALPSVSATTFSIGQFAGSDLNASGGDFVAYLFSTVLGISKIGTYLGNSSNRTIDCGFSAGARFVMIKRTDAAGDWYVFDTVRGITASEGTTPYILLNSAAAESYGGITSAAAGFALSNTTSLNVNGATYIFLAIA
jgi:hypothetical protein